MDRSSEQRLICREVCPEHVEEDFAGRPLGDGAGYMFTCPLLDHHTPGPRVWTREPESALTAGVSGLAKVPLGGAPVPG